MEPTKTQLPAIITQAEITSPDLGAAPTGRARQAAEALFAPKRPVTEQSVFDSSPAADSRKARISATSPQAPAPLKVEKAEPPVRLEQQARPEIPVSKFAHIRALVKYGMKPFQVAEVYGVAVGAIEDILRKV